jgi:hypothetical protein
VHAHLSLRQLSRVRVDFIASAGWGRRDEVARQFAERDAALEAAPGHEEVVLWFEHDLYDQLQLIQLLDWFGAHRHPRLSLVCEAEYLGSMAPERAASLFELRKQVSPDMLAEGRAAWRAFASPSPESISLAARSELPFLAPALRRHLEEFPWAADGLSRLERQVLQALASGPLDFRTLYRRAHHEQEDPIWLGDTVFAWHLARLAKDGLLEQRQGEWALSLSGRHAAEGRADAWSAGRQPRWLGGFLLAKGAPRWHPSSAMLLNG